VEQRQQPETPKPTSPPTANAEPVDEGEHRVARAAVAPDRRPGQERSTSTPRRDTDCDRANSTGGFGHGAIVCAAYSARHDVHGVPRKQHLTHAQCRTIARWRFARSMSGG